MKRRAFMQKIGQSAFACVAASSLAGFQTFCKIHPKDRPNIIFSRLMIWDGRTWDAWEVFFTRLPKSTG
jgi:hypothetical protein